MINGGALELFGMNSTEFFSLFLSTNTHEEIHIYLILVEAVALVVQFTTFRMERHWSKDT